MKFMKLEDLPLATQKMIAKDDYVGYVRVYYRNGYGSRLFFKDGANGTVAKIKEAEERGKQRYTEEMRFAVQSVCEFLFDDSNPNGRYQLYDFCEANGFEKKEYGYEGYCYMAHSAFHVIVRTDDDYFCRVYFWDRKDEEEFLGEIAG